MTDDKASYKIDTKFNYEDGVLEINIPEILMQLEDEDKISIAQLHAFDSAIWDEIKRVLRDGYSSDNYNHYIHKLRIELLAGDDADHVFKRTIRGILGDLNRAKARELHYRNHYWGLQRWCRDNVHRQDVPRETKFEYPPSVKDADVEKAIESAGGS